MDPRKSQSPDFYLVDELLSDEEIDVRSRVREFCERELMPIVNEHWERAQFPHPLVPKLAKLGVVGGAIEGNGCPGLSRVAAGIVTMEIARCDGSFATFFGVHSGLAMTSINKLGSDEQRARWLPDMASLKKIGAFALTEPDHGSDAVALETEATRDGDGYRLNGTKRWIGNSTFADLIVVWAREGEDVGAFVLEPPADGFTATPITGKSAKRASVQALLEFENVWIPAENRLPGALSFDDTTDVLTSCRPTVAWGALGHAVGSYEIALAHVMEREQFGEPLAGFQLVQYRLAQMIAEITAMQLICLRLSRLAEQDKMTPPMAAMAKMRVAKGALEVVSGARELLGGDGVLLENHVARHMGDVGVLATVEGTDAIQALIIGREITGFQAFS